MERFDEDIFIRHVMKDMLDKCGWAVVHKFSDHSAFADIRTVGLPQNFGHVNLQIAANLHLPIAMYIFRYFVEGIKKGIPPKVGKTYRDVLRHHMIRPEKAVSGGETICRLIISDGNGKFPDEPGCDADFLFQTDMKILHVFGPDDFAT